MWNFEPLKPHFYIVKLGFIEVHIISYFNKKKTTKKKTKKNTRLCVLVEAVHYLCFKQEYEKYRNLLSKKFLFLGGL